MSDAMVSIASWTWATAGAVERGAWVRQHIVACRGDRAALGNLFNLTEEGLERILSGDQWRPEYERPAVNYIEG